MNNLISIYLNYKIQRLIEYGIFLLEEDSPFIRKVFHEYFSIYVDNYYYNLFYTVETSSYSSEILAKEFQGIMVEMLDDYRQYELQESNQEYADHIQTIKSLKDFSLDILKIESLTIKNKEEIPEKVTTFGEEN